MKNSVHLPDIEETVVLNSPIHKVWETVSTAHGMESWFMPSDFKPIVGHKFHIQSQFGPSPCKVLEVDEPYQLSFSWDTDGWFLTFILQDLGEKTEFTLIHGGWKGPDAIITKANSKSSIIRDRMQEGWSEIVHERLKQVVEG